MSTAVRRILVPTDFSDCSEAALERAIGLARSFGAKLHLLHAHQIPLPGAIEHELVLPDGVWQQVESGALERLERLRARVGEQGVDVETRAVAAPPSGAIARGAEEIGADLIVMGTHGHTGLRHAVLGSVAEHTVRRAPCPVLTVQPRAGAEGRPERDFHRLLAAVDFSETSDHALAWAIDLGRRFGAEVHVAHAFQVPIPAMTPYDVVIPEAIVEEARKAAREKLERELDKVKGAGLTGEGHLTHVPAAQALAALAGEIDADLMVLGTHGHTGFKHWLLGSVAEHTLRIAPCPVLTVKRPE